MEELRSTVMGLLDKVWVLRETKLTMGIICFNLYVQGMCESAALIAEHFANLATSSTSDIVLFAKVTLSHSQLLL